MQLRKRRGKLPSLECSLPTSQWTHYQCRDCNVTITKCKPQNFLCYRPQTKFGARVYFHILLTGGGSASVHAGIHPPCQGDPPPGPHQGGKLRGIRSRPTAKGEVEGDQIQAHTQGGNWGGSDPGPHPREKLRGIRSRPTPKGEIQGDQVQVNIQVGNSGGSEPDPLPRWLLLQAVCIILECILVSQTSVCPWGGDGDRYHPLLGRHPPGQTPRANIPLGRHPLGRHQTRPPARHPPPKQMATEAGGMHPTGMHSCSLLLLNMNCKLNFLKSPSGSDVAFARYKLPHWSVCSKWLWRHNEYHLAVKKWVMGGVFNARGGHGGWYVLLWRQGTQPPFSFQARLLQLLTCLTLHLYKMPVQQI